MSDKMQLPLRDNKDAVFCAMLLQGHILYIDNLPDLTGFQDAPQRAFRLRAMGLPINDTKHTLPPKYPNKSIAFYSMDCEAVIEELGKERVEDFITRITKYYANVDEIQKGLQSKPQPLKSILAGELYGGGK